MWSLRWAQITFNWVSTTRVANYIWWNLDANSQTLSDFKAANHKGTYADFNIFVTMLQNSVLGCALCACRACHLADLLHQSPFHPCTRTWMRLFPSSRSLTVCSYAG